MLNPIKINSEINLALFMKSTIKVIFFKVSGLKKLFSSPMITP